MPRLEKILYSGYVAQGETVDEFEAAFSEYVGGGHSLSVNSGTAALHIALLLAGVRPGQEVVSTALTAEPTNVAIKMAGAKIRYADVDGCTGNICPDSIRETISAKTAAIVVVDYAGVPVDVNRIQNVAEEAGLPVIHDAAHSIGSKFGGSLAGCHFPFTAFSFQAIKHITTIDGGMLQVRDAHAYERGKRMRWFGIDKAKNRLENNIQHLGFKYHMNNVNAAIGMLQLEELQAVVDTHVSNGQFYDSALRGVSGVELLEYYPTSKPSYWLYTMKVENRDGLIRKLADAGVVASELHKRNDSHDYLNDFHQELPALDAFYPKLIHLPCGWWLDSEAQEKIVRTIESGW